MPDRDNEQDAQSFLPSIEIPIEWNIPPGLPTKYVTNLTIQATESEYIVCFYELFPPIVTGPAKNKFEAFNLLGSVKAECIGRFVISADRFPAFVEAMGGAIKVHESIQIQRQKESE